MNEAKSGAARRRRLLKGLLLGGFAAGTSTHLPERWEKPIVEAVTLPAHAATSPANEGLACPTLTIPGIEFSCEEPPTPTTTFYQVDDTASAACPELIESDSGSTNDMTIGIQDGSTMDGQVFRTITVGVGALNRHGLFCDDPATFNVPNAPPPLAFQALSEAPWTASYTVSGDVNGVVVSDITLEPA